jgi:hypothetical protein
MPVGRFEPGPVPLTLELPAMFAIAPPTTALVSPLGNAGITCLHLELPEATPPGDYEGSVEIENKERPIVVEVAPRKRVRVLPTRTRVEARPGERVNFAITIINLGNVSVDVPKKSAFGLFVKHGMDLAVGNVLMAEPARDERVTDRFIEEARAAHGGVAQVKVTKAAGALAPGESRELGLELRVPKKVVPGRSYSGMWALRDHNYKITIDVVEDQSKSDTGGKGS